MSDGRRSRVAVADAVVEFVSSRRGKPKAKYAGRTFTLDTKNGQRHHWRCDVRQCRSRLTTDVYENRHMVYRFREHNEGQHRRVASKIKRRDATYRQQMHVKRDIGVSSDNTNASGTDLGGYCVPVIRALCRTVQPAKKIGDFLYVLENCIGGLCFWRCVHVSCPGRCRTHDGDVVAGPSPHTHGRHTAADEPDTAHDGEDSSSCKEFQLDACEQAPPGVSEATTTDTDPKHREVSLQQHQQGSCSEISNGSADSPVVINSEPRSPLAPEAATTSDVGFSAVDKTAPTHAPDVITDATTAAGDDGPLFRVSSPFSCPDQRRSLQTAYDETSAAAAAAAAPEAFNYVDLSDYEGNDEKEQLPLRSIGAAVISEVTGERSHLTAAAGYGLAASGPSSGLAEVLQMTAQSTDSRERDLRVDILLQMRRLLEAETDLVNERRRNEVLRGKLLRRQLLGIVTESEPAPPYI
ncbi:uncharacterized protein [Dermacentor andersoni]|uniref:uncharacterized protein isoform X2 n=1 Tax=Dermacentor andersoni TaxID=34620 RepID=UPI0024179563|nr:uncharacterized protein LOC129382268 isoform X2 [Dermacentor andersoni]